MDRSRDWLLQAERDLEQASASREDQRHEWACFAARQAAEKAVKAQSGEAIRYASEIFAFVRAQVA